MTTYSILFVDDERNVLQGLRRSLRSMRKEWNMAFAYSGKDALDILQETPVDVIVSDMRMPEMDGAQLLEQACAEYPNTVRFVLSGQADRDTTYRAIGPSHQFFSKPCDIDALIAAISSACAHRDGLSTDAVRAISGLRCLPTPTRQRSALTAALQQEQLTINYAASLISRDPGMSLKTLQLTNSTYFGAAAAVYCPDRAARMLDIDVFQDLARQGRFSVPLTNEDAEDAYTQLVDVSNLTAMICKRIANLEGTSPQMQMLAFAAGLFSQIGDLLLHTEAGDHLADSCKTQTTAYLLTLWGAPASLISVLCETGETDRDYAALRIYLQAARYLATHAMVGEDDADDAICAVPDIKNWAEQCADLMETASAA